MSVTWHGMAEWNRDLHQLLATGHERFERVVSKAASNVRDEWRRRWDGHPHIKHLPAAIGYDVARHGGTITAEVGPAHRSLQGPLAHIIEYGTVNNAPMPGGLPAIEIEDPRFVAAVADEAVDLLEPGR